MNVAKQGDRAHVTLVGSVEHGMATRVAANGQPTPDISSLLLADADDPKQAHNRRAARKHQESQWLRRILILVFAIGLAAAPLFIDSLRGADDIDSTWLEYAAQVFTFGTPAALLLLSLCLFVYLKITDEKWDKERGHAGHLAAEESALGFMHAMCVVDKTRYVGLASSLFGVMTIIFGIFQIAHDPIGTRPSMALPLAQTETAHLAQIALGILVAWLGFNIGRRYVQGSVLAQQIMILATMASAQGIGHQKAQELTKRAALNMFERNPEWFYFRRKQKRATGHSNTD